MGVLDTRREVACIQERSGSERPNMVCGFFCSHDHCHMAKVLLFEDCQSRCEAQGYSSLHQEVEITSLYKMESLQEAFPRKIWVSMTPQRHFCVQAP